MKSPEKVIDHIVNWLSSYADNSGMNGFVVGVSGGIDSALTSTLCALTGKPVLCLEMPIHQEPNQVSRAKEHIAWLEKKFTNVGHHSLSLSTVFESFKKIVPSVESNENQFLSLANTRARFRMTTLYYFAAMKHYLVTGTGNKVEDFGVGFYTKYGDGGVDLSPIADLMKSEVFLLAKILGVIEVIQNAAPTDGLWGDDRTDEDQIGATYDELEWAMKNQNDNSNLRSKREKKVLDIYTKLNTQNQHKIQAIPVCKIPEDL
tara:strand:- start:6200 stop:6982 length:783 start_codon:yes stop_codon:yes gene_type:complete